MNPDTLSGDYQVAWDAGMSGATPIEIADLMALANRDFNLTQVTTVTTLGLGTTCGAGLGTVTAPTATGAVTS